VVNGCYTTDPLRVVLSRIAGSATYATLMVLWFLSQAIGWGTIFRDTFVCAISFIFWSVVLIVFGLPLGCYSTSLDYELVCRSRRWRGNDSLSRPCARSAPL
jgi:fructose-specific phosphotransferase system IIC component